MKAAIIGGAGKMGQWFARQLQQEGIEVIISDCNLEMLVSTGRKLKVQTAAISKAVIQAEVVIISVPPTAFESVIREIAPFAREGQIFIDVTSLKTGPVEIMHRYIKKGTILGAHPVFGPGAKSPTNQNFVLTPVKEEENLLADKIRHYLEERGANVSIMSPQEHDRLMSIVLGLAHFIAIVSADTLLGFENFQEMKKIGGTTFKLLYTLVESVISEDPDLYASLQMRFPNIKEVEGVFVEKAKIWADMVKADDRDGFARKMSTLREKLGKTDPEFKHAYENMYRITEKF